MSKLDKYLEAGKSKMSDDEVEDRAIASDHAAVVLGKIIGVSDKVVRGYLTKIGDHDERLWADIIDLLA